MMFILFDGMDLGIGILSPFMKNTKDRGLAMSSVKPFWDVNETWLIMAAVFLILGFTNAYGIFISTFYIPIILLVGLLVFRGCAFEFRHKDEQYFIIWDKVFFVSSFGVTLIFGVFIGNLVNVLNIDYKMIYRGTFLDLFNPISLASSILTVCGFALIGSNWLALKTNDKILKFANKASNYVAKLCFMSSVLLIISIIRHDVFYSICCFRIYAIAILVLLSYSILWYIAKCGKEQKCGKLTLILSYVFAIYGGMCLVLITYPYIVPYKFTIIDLLRIKSSTHGVFNIMLYLFIVLLFVLFYFYKNYNIFKGKINKDISY